MIDWEKDADKKKNAIAFVEATQTLIDSDGLENISIRKIGQKSGFHNSTIYLYFKDVNQLILLASLKHFRDYSSKLAEFGAMTANPVDKFIAIWQAFGQTVFSKPHIFRNFFFGKYSDNLTPIITQYYQLFPEEKATYTREIEEMYYGGNIFDRCLQVLRPLVEVGENLVTEDNLELVNTITIACLKQLLDQACADSSLDPDDINERMLRMLCHVTGVN